MNETCLIPLPRSVFGEEVLPHALAYVGRGPLAFLVVALAGGAAGGPALVSGIPQTSSSATSAGSSAALSAKPALPSADMAGCVGKALAAHHTRHALQVRTAACTT